MRGIYTCFCLLLGLALAGQKQVFIDRIILPGGNLLEGSIIDTPDTAFVHLSLMGSDSTIRIPVGLIEKIEVDDKGKRMLINGHSIPAHGWYGGLSLSLLSGQSYFSYDETKRQSLSLDLEAGYYVRPWLTVGAGVAFDYYDEFILPVYLQSRVFLTRWANTPFLHLQVGKGIAVERMFNREEFDKSHARWMWQPGLGIRLASRRKQNLSAEIGYKFQGFTYDYQYPDDWWLIREVERITYKRVIMRIGLTF
ncbi:hypothetical protein [Lewinella sp. LCG006]|uniref:hypothetical protein n=1 Tax=Lewinella sp. LCG006 TaxID=3231911 RepID=UPI00345F99F2